MVAQFPTQTTSPAKSLSPLISIDVNTYLLADGISLSQSANSASVNRLCVVSIEVSNIKKSLAVATFSRIFAYAQSLANNDINPVSNVNQNTLTPAANLVVNNPLTGIKLAIDSTEDVPVCALTLKVNNLRLDYMDEYFNSTLTYLSNAIANDLNPDA